MDATKGLQQVIRAAIGSSCIRTRATHANGLDPYDWDDADLDSDGDGASNREEYQWSTNPDERNDLPSWMYGASRGGWRAILQ